MANSVPRVLILEYESILCALLRMALSRSGYAPIVCEDPFFARDMIFEYQPEIMVMDTRLPSVNAIDLLHEFKKENLLNGRHVVVLSSLGFSCIVQKAAEAGADDFLVKPFEMEYLIFRINNRQRGLVNKKVSPTVMEM